MTSAQHVSQAVTVNADAETALPIVRALRGHHPSQDVRMQADRALALFFAGEKGLPWLVFQARVLQIMVRRGVTHL